MFNSLNAIADVCVHARYVSDMTMKALKEANRDFNAVAGFLRVRGEIFLINNFFF